MKHVNLHVNDVGKTAIVGNEDHDISCHYEKKNRCGRDNKPEMECRRVMRGVVARKARKANTMSGSMRQDKELGYRGIRTRISAWDIKMQGRNFECNDRD